ncbi:hypothetical protein WA1_29825 [Scytonema hofmannii PCC 7110]|uniref:non-specific serine/threonine protein kinase n=1 Tax=Scytonema hofmannii PCC 7110 TaxID=128403 RepID=A0A139X4X9_9CYAN|nr:protein kinase [Scytonema hofmannii]KYC39757.1 hypothetical protein WA1_29825 [Scytonema hofmannii PCC 7110]
MLKEKETLVRRYEIIQHLCSGGFTETYLAEDKFLPDKPRCVVKQLRLRSLDPDTLKKARELFEAEAQVLDKLGTHDQIPQLLGYFEENQEFYLVEEYIDGENLEKELAQVKKLSEEKVLILLQEVLEVVKFVHQENVIHREIKPANIIRRKTDNKIVLTGFGAVKQVQTQIVTAEGETSFTIPVGTKGYMANEVLGGKPRRSSDIYALGITAIHALTGKDPGKDDPPELEQDPRTRELIWRKHANVNNRLATILDKMIKSHFRDRYQVVDEVLEDLQKLQNSWENTVSTFTSTIATKKLPSLRLPKFKYVFAILVAIGIVSAIPQLLPSLPKLSVVHLSSNTEALFQEGKKLATDGKYEEAIRVYDKALKHNPKNAHDIWEARAIALFGLEKYEDSLTSIVICQ